MALTPLPDVRFYTSDDEYFYLVDNRPLTDLAQRDDILIDYITAQNSIAAAPSYMGQIAVVGRVGYMAVGTASASDWIQVTQ